VIISLIRVHATITEAWTVGAPELSGQSNVLVCRRNPFGQLEIPASLIAGALRHHLRSCVGDEVTETFMGSRPPSGDDDDPDSLTPSAIRVLGTRVHNNEHLDTEFRVSTSIDPKRGAARNSTLRETEMAPPGTDVEIDLRLDLDPATLTADRALLDKLLEHLNTWRFFVGRGRTSGHGAAHVTDVTWGELDLSDAAQLRTWLTAGGPELVATVAVTGTTRPVDGHDLKMPAPLGQPIHMRARDGVLTRGGRPQDSVAKANAHHALRRQDGFFIPGSSLKGVIRARAGYILRSLNILGDEECLDAVGCGATGCPLCYLFGSSERRGAIRIADAVLQTEKTVTRTHVAIDRISGGASEHRLFSETEIPFQPTMSLTLEPLDSVPPDWSVTLLSAVVLDIHDGYVTLGSRGSTGLGHMELDGSEGASGSGMVAVLRNHLNSHSLEHQITRWRTDLPDEVTS
jgi:CRISPR/Cas system CSM-associated protein Csm3 (group 7 of RAMP superfamily)